MAAYMVLDVQSSVAFFDDVIVCPCSSRIYVVTNEWTVLLKMSVCLQQYLSVCESVHKPRLQRFAHLQATSAELPKCSEKMIQAIAKSQVNYTHAHTYLVSSKQLR